MKSRKLWVVLAKIWQKIKKALYQRYKAFLIMPLHE
jgi:hypothetical protein